jgi:hydrogenase-4 transcriptional activator
MSRIASDGWVPMWGTAYALGPLRVQLELEMWREACRHLRVEESLARMLPGLARHLPVDAIAIRRIDIARARIETIAFEGRPIALPNAPFDLSPGSLARALAVFRGDAYSAALDADDPIFGAQSVEGNVLVAPLAGEEGPAGLLALFARDSERFEPAHLTLARAIVEPFAVALENDRRVHELARLREAALAENRALLSRLSRQSLVESIVGERGGLRGIMERVAQVAATDVPVLILGETGSGKEVIARAIHERSARHAGPMVRVNCGAIPTELVDSELFGHERGSFTGAIATRKGWFERADGGTLLLDEVGELPLAAQVRLLRILQEGTLSRVGGERPIHVDVRIVAATHRDLHAMVTRGEFREDLWYRLSVFPVRLPPLRERLEDLPALASHFAAKAGERLAGIPLAASPEDIQLLLSYAWPGNVRELAAVIERAAILGHGKRLDVINALGAAPPTVLVRPQNGAPPAPATLETLDASMVSHIERALAATGGRIEGPKGAAALLAINPHTLRAKMRRLSIDWSRFRRSP